MAARPRTRRGLVEWLSTTTTAIFLLDHRRLILFFNSGCESLTGWAAGDVIGQICRWGLDAPHDSHEALTTACCPPESIFDGPPQTVRRVFKRRDGGSESLLVHFIPLRFANDPDLVRVLGLIMPDTVGIELAPPSASIEVHSALIEAKAALRSRYQLEHFVAASPSMRRVAAQIQVARATGCAVHIAGESGTGKSHVARTIHQISQSSVLAFVPLDCSLRPAQLAEVLGRLLKVETGESPNSSFEPGAVSLEQLDRLPRDLQQQIVDSEFAGTARSLRWFTSSKRKIPDLLRSEVLLPNFAAGLGTLTIELPPLRDRVPDIPLLAQHFLEQRNRESERQFNGFSNEVLAEFQAYHWPGNLVELEAVIHSATTTAPQAVVTKDDLNWQFRAGQAARSINPAAAAPVPKLEPYLAEIETELIRRALAWTKNNKSEAAELLGVSRPRLYRRMADLGLAESANGTDAEG